MATTTMAIRGKKSAIVATSDHPHAEWQVATITGITIENSHAKTFHLTLPGKLPHLAGQHCDIRLSAPDGYQAARSYSIASAPESEDALEVTVAIIPGGEVSGYLGSTAKVGDQLEIKSPLGYYFVWTGKSATPVTLIAGGSGIVPLMSIIRHHQDICSSAPMRLLAPGACGSGPWTPPAAPTPAKVGKDVGPLEIRDGTTPVVMLAFNGGV